MGERCVLAVPIFFTHPLLLLFKKMDGTQFHQYPIAHQEHKTLHDAMVAIRKQIKKQTNSNLEELESQSFRFWKFQLKFEILSRIKIWLCRII